MRIKNIQDRTVIYLDGRLDMAFLRSGIEEKLSNTIAQKETKDVIINLKKVEYVSSSGLRVLINALRKLHDKDGTLKITNMNEEVKKIFQAAQVISLFQVFDSMEDALKN